MTAKRAAGRLSTFAAAFVIARRDFVAIMFSRSFIFFLLAPLFPVIIAIMAGGIGQQVQESTRAPVLGLAMAAADIDAMIAARAELEPRIGAILPEFGVEARLEPGEAFDPQAALTRGEFAAIASGSPTALVLTASSSGAGRSRWWRRRRWGRGRIAIRRSRWPAPRPAAPTSAARGCRPRRPGRR
jgi:ABC-2 type transport system permease protein